MIALFAAAVAAASQAAPASAPRAPPDVARPRDNPAVVEQIRRLEHDWGQAFVRRDFALIERIVAPEYRLATVSAQGRVSLTYRDEWMRNTLAFEVRSFEAEVVEVTTAGNTAVALVQGLWTVRRRADGPFEAIRFAVTDTWLRRNGRWHVVHRYSQRLPEAPGHSWAPLTASAHSGATSSTSASTRTRRSNITTRPSPRGGEDGALLLDVRPQILLDEDHPGSSRFCCGPSSK